MIGVDTNVLLRWLANDMFEDDDALFQSELVEEFVAQAAEPLFVNQIVVVEAIWVLRRRAKLAKTMIVEIVSRLLDASTIVVQERDILLATLDTYSRHSGGFADHLIGEINRQYGCRTTLTFDRAASKSPNFSELQR